MPVAVRVANARAASSAALLVHKHRIATDPLRSKFGDAALNTVRAIGACAKQRCTNPNSAAFADYGGRGIEFRFPSIRAFAEWVLQNLGARPSPVLSLDRIDNERHYEPGNLRWATRSEQARNKRAYRRTDNGQRIRELHAHRPDLTYETLRLWIKQGASNEQILQREKYARPRV